MCFTTEYQFGQSETSSFAINLLYCMSILQIMLLINKLHLFILYIPLSKRNDFNDKNHLAWLIFILNLIYLEASDLMALSISVSVRMCIFNKILLAQLFVLSFSYPECSILQRVDKYFPYIHICIPSLYPFCMTKLSKFTYNITKGTETTPEQRP